MSKGVVFVAGVYGVGKSYLCRRASNETGIPFYSAGDLISEQNGEKYGRNKKVTDADNNQDILIRCIEDKIVGNDILLAGHMCVFDTNGNISKIDLNQLRKMHIKKMILLSASINEVYNNLSSRDNVLYSIATLEELMCVEKDRFIALSELMKLPANIIEMTYSEKDVIEMKKYIEGEGN